MFTLGIPSPPRTNIEEIREVDAQIQWSNWWYISVVFVADRPNIYWPCVSLDQTGHRKGIQFLTCVMGLRNLKSSSAIGGQVVQGWFVYVAFYAFNQCEIVIHAAYSFTGYTKCNISGGREADTTLWGFGIHGYFIGLWNNGMYSVSFGVLMTACSVGSPAPWSRSVSVTTEH